MLKGHRVITVFAAGTGRGTVFDGVPRQAMLSMLKFAPPSRLGAKTAGKAIRVPSGIG
jgi:hypothetical protein